jgi:hypothetical protein
VSLHASRSYDPTVESRDVAGIKDSSGNRIRRSALPDRVRTPSLLGWHFLRVMGGREHYSHRNRPRRICCFLSRDVFLSTAKQLLKKCLRYLKRLEVLLGTFRESKGADRSLISHEISPSMYEGTCAGSKASKIFSIVIRTDSHTWLGLGEGRNNCNSLYEF